MASLTHLLHAHCDRIVGSESTKALSLLRPHQIVVLALMHSVCVQCPPEPFVYFLNLLCQALAWILALAT